jgi:hypothetical protein
VCIVFYAINLILPIDSFLRSFNYIGIEEKDTLHKNFDDVYFQLEHYDRINPVTMKKAKLTYLDKLFEKHIISEEEHKRYTVMIENNESVNIFEIYNDNRHKDYNYVDIKHINRRGAFAKRMNEVLFNKRKSKHGAAFVPLSKYYITLDQLTELNVARTLFRNSNFFGTPDINPDKLGAGRRLSMQNTINVLGIKQFVMEENIEGTEEGVKEGNSPKKPGNLFKKMLDRKANNAVEGGGENVNNNEDTALRVNDKKASNNHIDEFTDRETKALVNNEEKKDNSHNSSKSSGKRKSINL